MGTKQLLHTMLTIDYLNTAISTCLTMRKIKNVILEEEVDGKIEFFRLRPQNHLMVVSPFGTFKSSITKQLSKILGEDIFANDDFTKPSIEGSITKDGDYVPSILVHVGGKIFVIDEWNSVGPFGQNSMLSLLENQESSRSLGFKVKNPYKFRDKFGFVDYSVQENLIKIKATFSCIAYAMEFPIYDNSQKSKALLSRFSPIFINPSKEYIIAGTQGQFQIKIEDYSAQIDNIIVPAKIYMETNNKFYEYMAQHELWPSDTHDYGFVSRTLSEIIRYGIFEFLKENKGIKKAKEITITDSCYFERTFDFIEAILLQFTNPETKDKLTQYKQVKEKHQGASKIQLARLMGVSVQTISHYEERLIQKLS